MKKIRPIEDIIAEQMMKLVRWGLSKMVKPDITIDKVTDLDEKEIERIKEEYGIEAIILDVDDTLRTDMQTIPQVNQEWLESIRGKVKVIILSNGIDRKMEDYFSKKGIDYISFAHKPFKKNFIKACQRMDVKPENVMVIGDSLFDDVHGGKKNNMKTTLVKQVEKTVDERE